MKLAHLLVATSLFAFAPRASFAQPKPAAADAKADADAAAREHFQRGQRLTAAGDHAAAYREYAAGYALSEIPSFLFNMAESARASGDLAKARDNYRKFLRADPKNQLAPTARQRLAALDKERDKDKPAVAVAAAPAAPAPAAAPPASPPPAAPPAVAKTTPPPAAPPPAVAKTTPPPAAALTKPATPPPAAAPATKPAVVATVAVKPATPPPAAAPAPKPAAPPPAAAPKAGPNAVVVGPQPPNADVFGPQPAPAAQPDLAPPPPSNTAPMRPASAGTPMTSVATNDQPKPIYKKWQLWAAVGGVVAGTVAVYALSSNSKACASGCTELNFR